jgi:hypothetical protein
VVFNGIREGNLFGVNCCLFVLPLLEPKSGKRVEWNEDFNPLFLFLSLFLLLFQPFGFFPYSHCSLLGTNGGEKSWIERRGFG